MTDSALRIMTYMVKDLLNGSGAVSMGQKENLNVYMLYIR